MKKLIAILVVFAVMTTALFAQEGSWSIWGSGEIGTLLNFVPLEMRDDAQDKSEQVLITVGAHAYNRYDWYGNVAGTMGIGYSKGSLSTGLSFGQADKIGANVNYDGNGLRFQAESNLIDLFEGNYSPGRLWGWQKLLDGMIHIEAAVNSRDTQFWNSAGLIDDTYTKVDHHNYLVVDVAPIAGLNFGFMLPGIFTIINNPGDRGWTQGVGKGSLTSVNPWQTNPYGDMGGVGSYAQIRRLIEGSLEQMTFGVKYAAGPLNVAAQYGLRRQQVAYLAEKAESSLRNVFYLGAQFKINDQMSADLAAHGEFFRVDGYSPSHGTGEASFGGNAGIGGGSENTGADKLNLRFGGRFNFGAGPLSTRIDFIYFNDVNSGRENGFLRIRPYGTYDIIPNTLRFQLDTRVDLPFGDFPLDGNYEIQSTAFKENDLNRGWALRYRVIPELFFNTIGTGAGGYWGTSNGIIVRYRIEGNIYGAEYMDAVNAAYGDSLRLRHRNDPRINAFDIVFKLGF
jgi:hypothetical protein